VTNRPYPFAAHHIGDETTVLQGARTIGPIPLAVTAGANFAGVSNFMSGELTLETDQGMLNDVQTLYFDMSACPIPVTITFVETGQTLTLPPKSQGYLPIMVASNVVWNAIAWGAPLAGTYSVNLWFLNRQVDSCVWSTIEQPQRVLAQPGSAAVNTGFTITANSNIALPSGKQLFVYGFDVSGGAVTTQGAIQVSLSNIAATENGNGTLVWDVAVPALTAQDGIIVYFEKMCPTPLRSANGTALPTLTIPAMGAGQVLAPAANLYYGIG
jgi:hypothetical protein